MGEGLLRTCISSKISDHTCCLNVSFQCGNFSQDVSHILDTHKFSMFSNFAYNLISDAIHMSHAKSGIWILHMNILIHINLL